MKDNKTAKDMRHKLIEGALPAMEKLMEVFTDPSGEYQLTNDQAETMKLIWPTVSAMIVKESDVVKIDAQNTADIITMLKDGKLSILEAKDLMSMLSIQSDIEDIKALLVKVNQLTGDGATYNG